jgi:uncharacterized protein YbaP (TraB family)
MSKRLLCALSLSLLSLSAWSQTEAGPDHPAPVQQDATEVVAEKILVVGQRPGPGLWKVTKDDHVLWIFGAYAPLSKNMEWRSQQVEQILSESQEFLAAPSAQAGIGFFRSLTLLPHVFGMKKNPDGAYLKDLLPPEVYARWLVQKKKYIGDDSGIERERPIFAAAELSSKAMQQAGLTGGNEISAKIFKIAKDKKIKTTYPGIKLEIDDPSALLKEYKKTPLDDVACFAKTLDELETTVEAMRARANAWAKGDIAVISSLNFAEREEACNAAILNSAMAKGRPALLAVEGRMREAWLAAAEKALAANALTFAMLPMKVLLDPKGYLAALEARGYTVARPE